MAIPTVRQTFPWTTGTLHHVKQYQVHNTFFWQMYYTDNTNWVSNRWWKEIICLHVSVSNYDIYYEFSLLHIFSFLCIFFFPLCAPRRIFILLYILLSSLWTKEDFHIIVYFAFLTVNQGGFSYYCIFCYENPPWFTVRKAKYTIIWKSSLVHSEESKIYNNMKILLGSQWGKQNIQ
jgi:hypothetical protein